MDVGVVVVVAAGCAMLLGVSFSTTGASCVVIGDCRDNVLVFVSLERLSILSVGSALVLVVKDGARGSEETFLTWLDSSCFLLVIVGLVANGLQPSR